MRQLPTIARLVKRPLIRHRWTWARQRPPISGRLVTARPCPKRLGTWTLLCLLEHRLPSTNCRDGWHRPLGMLLRSAASRLTIAGPHHLLGTRACTPRGDCGMEYGWMESGSLLGPRHRDLQVVFGVPGGRRGDGGQVSSEPCLGNQARLGPKLTRCTQHWTSLPGRLSCLRNHSQVRSHLLVRSKSLELTPDSTVSVSWLLVL
jgi:hypothetical protein